MEVPVGHLAIPQQSVTIEGVLNQHPLFKKRPPLSRRPPADGPGRPEGRCIELQLFLNELLIQLEEFGHNFRFRHILPEPIGFHHGRVVRAVGLPELYGHR